MTTLIYAFHLYGKLGMATSILPHLDTIIWMIDNGEYAMDIGGVD